MQYRSLGTTGWDVSVLGYGASPLGSEFRNIDEGEGIRTVHTAVDQGINFIDVSPFYGRTKAETVLGKALREIPRDRYILATKVGRYDLDQFDFSPQRVVASVEESMQRLGVEHIDLIQCHDIEFGDIDVVINQTIPALRGLQQQGKVSAVGITGLPLPIFTRVTDVIHVDTILSYGRHTLNDTGLANLITPMKKLGVGVINASPMGMGLLTDKGPPDWHPADDAIKAACAQAAALCQSRGTTISKLALQFAIANPGIATTLVGTASPSRIAQNIDWADQPIDEDLLADVRRALAPIQNQTWPSGRAENN